MLSTDRFHVLVLSAVAVICNVVVGGSVRIQVAGGIVQRFLVSSMFLLTVSQYLVSLAGVLVVLHLSINNKFCLSK